MSKPALHVLDIYGTNLHLTSDRRAWATLRRRYPGMVDKAPDAAGWCQDVTFHPTARGLTEQHVVLWVDLERHDTIGGLINTLAHEAAHAAQAIMGYIGHGRGDAVAGDEPTAYLVGWITEWMLENLPSDGVAALSALHA